MRILKTKTSIILVFLIIILFNIAFYTQEVNCADNDPYSIEVEAGDEFTWKITRGREDSECGLLWKIKIVEVENLTYSYYAKYPDEDDYDSFFSIDMSVYHQGLFAIWICPVPVNDYLIDFFGWNDYYSISGNEITYFREVAVFNTKSGILTSYTEYFHGDVYFQWKLESSKDILGYSITLFILVITISFFGISVVILKTSRISIKYLNIKC